MRRTQKHPCERKAVEGVGVVGGLQCLNSERPVGVDDGTDENRCTETAGRTDCRYFGGNLGAEGYRWGRN
jgi:hypothetical protein